MSVNKKKLRQIFTFEQVLNLVKEDKPVIQDLPDRFSTQLRDSQKYQNLISDDLTEIEQHAQRIAKHNLLQHEIKDDKEKSSGNHQVDKATNTAQPSTNMAGIVRIDSEAETYDIYTPASSEKGNGNCNGNGN